MSEMPRKPSPGDYILSAFNRLMDTVRRERVVAGDGIIVKQLECGKSISAIRQHAPNKAPWFGRQTVADTIRVNKGRWTRNTDLGNVGLVLDCGANEYRDATVTSDQYLSAVIYRTDQTEDPRLHPTEVTLVNSDTSDRTAVIAGLGGGKYYGGHVVLGKRTGGVWAQLWHGGDITDALEVNDGDSADTTSPIVKTLEKKPSGAHINENQLVNADAADADNYNVPYLPKDAGGAGDLTWARVDTHKASTTSKSLEVASGDLQVRGWATAAETAQATGDLILAQRVVSGARDAVYLDVDDLSVSHADTAGHSDTVGSISDHDHGVLLGLSDDDHAQYVIMVGNGRATNTGDVDVTGNVNVNTGVYKHGTVAGISDTREWDDVNGKHHAVTISGGIITAWTVA